MALRTYTCLRLGAIGVIFVLAVSILKEFFASDPDCLNRSISAYYYTSVQTVFVGTLIALGLVMIVLWGKTSVEDGLFNLAGLLAPVVAFVPTGDKPYHCGVTDALGNQVQTNSQVEKVVDASLPAVDNNMFAYLCVVGAVILGAVMVGWIAPQRDWKLVTDDRRGYWFPVGAAAALWVFLTAEFWWNRHWIYDHAHKASAILMFVFIVAAVFDIGRQKQRGNPTTGELPDRWWMKVYWGVGTAMSAGAVVIALVASWLPDKVADHKVFILEAWMILMLAIFWGLQTWDRWREGAPRTPSEVQAQAAAAAPAE
jgi:hypothetical protein